MSLLNSRRVLSNLRRPFEVVFLRYILLLVFFIPALMFIVWLFTPKQEIKLVLIDKSVPDEMRWEHASINWVLNHERIVNGQGDAYKINSDYYGFFPGVDDSFSIRDLSSFKDSQLDSLVSETDLVYLADAYGVYSHTFFDDQSKPNHLIYGGLQAEDVDFLTKMSAQNKVVIAEFSLFPPPTKRKVRKQMESTFGIKWTGWVGRYFSSLDTTANKSLPQWVITLYRDQHSSVWPFKSSGIVLVNGSKILILENETHLDREVPAIETQSIFSQQYGIPETIDYPLWFDIVASSDTNYQIISSFNLPVNQLGDSLIQVFNIPRQFPAVLRSKGGSQSFYYFSGDFSDNPVSSLSAYFRGIHFLQGLFYHKDQVYDSRQFFWRYYRPLLTKILRSDF